MLNTTVALHVNQLNDVICAYRFFKGGEGVQFTARKAPFLDKALCEYF